MFVEHEEIDMELTEADNSTSLLLKQIEELKSKLAEKDLEIEALKSKWDAKEGKELSCHVMSSDDKCKQYRIISYHVPWHVYYQSLIFLDAGPNGENVILYQNQQKKDMPGGKTKSSDPSMKSFLLTLLRLCRNYDVNHLSFLFGVDHTIVSNSIITWINYIYVRLGSILIWPTMEHVAQYTNIDKGEISKCEMHHWLRWISC